MVKYFDDHHTILAQPFGFHIACCCAYGLVGLSLFTTSWLLYQLTYPETYCLIFTFSFVIFFFHAAFAWFTSVFCFQELFFILKAFSFSPYHD